jgi:hypothetical protein
MSNSTTNRLLLINSILLALILCLLIFVNYDDLKYKLSSDSSDSFSIDDENNEEVRHYQKQDSIEVDYKGLKNDTINLPTKISELITAELDSVNWNEALSMEDMFSLYHETVFAQNFPSSYGIGTSFFVITYSNSTANLCHACKGKVSLFEFQGKDENWQLIRKYLAFGYGDEDALNPRGLELARIGYDNKYGVVVHTGYSNMGHDQETKSVYSVVNDSLKLVFDFKFYEYYNDYPKDIEYTDGYSSTRILNSKKAYFDIETKSEDIEWSDRTSVNRFVFNGEEYVESNRD